MSAPEDTEAKEQNLSKRMRLLEGNRKSYAGDARTIIQKQNDTVNALKKENQKLNEELKTTEAQLGFSSKFVVQAAFKEDSYNTLQRKVDLELRKLRDYENKVVDYKKSLGDNRVLRAGTMGGVNATQENHQAIDKQIKVLENRLDQALIKFNEALSYNKSLREQIDNLRRERVVFDGIYKKLEKELHEKKKQMAEIIEKSNLYYEDRDASGVELKHLRGAAEKDIQQYERHFEELELMLEANKNVENSIKAMRTTSKQTKNEDDDTIRKKKQLKATQELDQEQEQRSVNFQDIVDSLKEATGIQDMEVLHQKFVKAEEQNFSMYNFVNEKHAEAERLEEEIEQLKDYTKGQGDSGRFEQLKDLEVALSSAETHAETLEESTVVAKKRIEDVMAHTAETFHRIGCGMEVMEMNGITECTESNMMLYLGLIEERANEILAAYNIAQASEVRTKARLKDEERKQARERRAQERQARREQGEDLPDEDDEEEEEADEMGGELPMEKAKFLGQGPSVPMGQTNLSKVVEGKLPATGDSFGNDFAEDGEDERPFSQEELRQQSEARLARQLHKDDRGDRMKKKGKEKRNR